MHRRLPVRRRLCAPGVLAALATVGTLAALAALAPRTAAAAEPQQPTFAAPEEDDGKERPFAPDQRTGHIYLSPIFGVVGAVGDAGPNIPLSSLIGLGYSVGGILGLGVSRHATVQIFGERSAFEAPGNCRVGCSGWGYTLGLGVTYHLSQALAVDPWGSFGVAYRRSTFETMAPLAQTVDGRMCAQGAICPESYGGFDVARIAFGGDFYPVPWVGFGPYVEVDAGTNLGQPYVTPPVALPPNVSTGPRAYAYFHLGVRVTFDPVRRQSANRPGAVREGSIPQRPAAAAAASTSPPSPAPSKTGM